MAVFRIYWKRPRKLQLLPELNNYPQPPAPRADGHYPAHILLKTIRYKSKYRLQSVELSWFANPEVVPGFGKVGPYVPGGFKTWKVNRRRLLLVSPVNVYPASPPPPAADDLITAWTGRFNKTKPTRYKLLTVPMPEAFPAAPPAPEQPLTAFQPPETFRRKGWNKLVIDPLLSYYEEITAVYEYISWRLIGADGEPITGASPTLIIRRVSDRLYFDWSDLTFKGPEPVTLKKPMTESDASKIPGVYEVNLNIYGFNGRYQLYAQDEGNNLYSESELIVVDGAVWHDNTTNDLASMPASVWARQLESEGTYTAQQIMSILLAHEAGLYDRTTGEFKTPNGNAVRNTTIATATGNRTSSIPTPSS